MCTELLNGPKAASLAMECRRELAESIHNLQKGRCFYVEVAALMLSRLEFLPVLNVSTSVRTVTTENFPPQRFDGFNPLARLFVRNPNSPRAVFQTVPPLD